MTNRITVDDEGGVFESIEYAGVCYPLFPGLLPRLKKLPYLQAREDDVLICSYPRSGTNWIQEIVWMLQANNTERKSTTNYELDLTIKDDHELEALSSPRLLNTHLRFSHVPADFFRKKCKLIQMRRNPKDALVSYFNLLRGIRAYNGNFKGFLYQMFHHRNIVYGTWYDHIKEWEAGFKKLDDSTYLILQYEDMKQDLLAHVTRVSAFLELSRSENFCREVAEQCSFKVMKQEKDKMHLDLSDIWFNDGETVLYRKGEIGDWKNWFTVADNEAFDEEYGREMKGYEHLKFRYEP